MTSALEAFRNAPLQRIRLPHELTYRRFGEGPAVLLVHGWPLNGATYRELVRLLAPHFTCYVPDLPGSGLTPWIASTTDIFEEWGALLAAFVEALGLERVAIVGHDSGGGVARVTAARLGARVSMLGLIDTELSHHAPKLVRFFQVAARLPGSTFLFGALLRSRWYRRSALGFGRCFAERAHLDGDFHEACVVPLLSHLDGAMKAISHADLSGAHLPRLHARISAPTVLFWGEDDKFFPIDHARAMGAEFPDLRAFEVLPGQGLFVQDESPRLVADKLLPWLTRLHGATVSGAVLSA